MDDPEPRRARIQARAGAVVVLVLVGLGCAVLVSALAPRGGGGELAPPTPSATEAASAGILVHVLGAVVAPGLYELREGDRVVDAVAAAGGFAEGADQAGVNLARPVADGEQLLVPLVGQAPVPGAPAADGRVNLNTADAAALETLPRVGPALADRIIQWRDANGGFTAVEDLLNVSGIGDKTFEGLRDLVTV
ncbi:ComEA family DNA-binding protein [Salinibacterium soli]|uniref:ComEA family DNA-binding protein n=1 Tax=Antiquaquibacter soli TaxID=3064523 RepID=A0ABT9BMI0_9MICO|nr:ComEA family DNA-binding protein [Protaetiibacter sp. WY-16]MDO7882213.1 ComEA family DNA-binding protein [Protaetiibacter sp. WY-16]